MFADVYGRVAIESRWFVVVVVKGIIVNIAAVQTQRSSNAFH